MLAANNDQAQQFRASELRIEREPYTDRWLFRWLTCKPLVANQDGSISHYQNQGIAPPYIQIHGIREMIRKQTRDPVCDWKAKTFDCFRYLVSLDQGAQGNEPWYTMLQDALNEIKPIILITSYQKELKQAHLHSPAVPSGETNRFAHLLDPNHPLMPPLMPRQGSIAEVPHDTDNEDELMLPKFRSYPEREDGPWKLTAINKRYMEQEESWALSRRDRAAQEYRECLTVSNYGEPVMPLPKNWNGPVELSSIDEDMKQTWDTLREHQRLTEQLEKADREHPRRPLISEIRDKIVEGQRGVPWAELDLQFGVHEFVHGNDAERELRLIAKEEVSWLWYLCKPVQVDHQLPEDIEHEGSFVAFWRRIRSGLSDHYPYEQTLRASRGFLSKEEIIKKFNKGLRGPVEKWSLRQMAPDVWEDTKNRKVLESSQDDTHYGAREEYHPEQTIRWPEPPQGLGDNGEVDEWEAYKQFLRQAEDERLTAEDLNLERALRATGHSEANLEATNQEEQTRGFYCRLGYRLGHTIRILSEKYKQDMETLKSQGREEASRQSLVKALNTWKRTRAREDDTSQEGSRKRRCTSYKDIVREHVPERFQRDWDDDPTRDAEAECAQVVGEGVLWELHDSQSYNQAPGNKCRREALWTFGHPSMKPKAKKFWDINRWNPHQQLRELRNVIDHADSDDVESLFYKRHPDTERQEAQDSRFYTDSTSRSLPVPRANQGQSAAEVSPEIAEVLAGDGQQPQGDGEDDQPAAPPSWLETVMGPRNTVMDAQVTVVDPQNTVTGPQNTESGHSQESESGIGQSGQSDKENVGQGTVLASPDDSPTQGGIAAGPLQDVTHIHEPGAESEPDLYGRSEDEIEGLGIQNQHSSFSIFEDGPSE
ncbi:unnamed protein product [Clonostachys rosea]|uniref:Uncharacterized protein n=1 Tax=Bionectria ochroleuca TaxID=29856 RepID=A0ABY6UXI6_BIOOC|nr:unnamed protein product [Clonostachys rosea]